MQTTDWRNTLANALLSDENLRQAIMQSLDALDRHQQKILEEMSAEVKDYFQNRRAESTCQIVVLLASTEERDKLTKQNIFPVPEEFATSSSSRSRSIYYKDTVYPGGPFFLDCDYGDIAVLCGREYMGHSAEGDFRYKLVPHGRFARVEHYLERLCNLYNLDALPLFSPYARHAVDICLLDEVVKPDEADFAWRENNLPVLSERLLMWNIKVHDTREAQSGDLANGQKVYRFGANEQTYILPNYRDGHGYDSNVAYYRDGYELVLITPSDIINSNGVPWEIFSLKGTLLPADAEIFTNEPLCRSRLPLRVNTRGDIDRVLTQLRKTIGQEEYNAAFAAWEERADECFAPYATNVAYPVSAAQELVRRRQKSPVCMIKFFGARKYLTDYVNWVLYVLNSRYPEFNWAGVPA